MIKKILIPTDGYGLEDHVINYAARAFPFAEFHVISVINTYEGGVQLTNLLYEEMKKGAQRAVYEAENKIRAHGIEDIKTTVAEGVPSIKIVAYAKLYNIDLIAMRVYSRRYTASAQRMGSTVKNVLKKSRVPVLTLAENCDRLPIKKILLLTDGTHKTKRAENYAIHFASTHGAKIEALYFSQEGGKGEKILQNFEWKAKYWNVEVKKSTVEEMGNLKKHFENNDLAIMGLGKKTIFGCKVGHFSQYVATHSPIPVIFVRKMKERWSSRALTK